LGVKLHTSLEMGRGKSLFWMRQPFNEGPEIKDGKKVKSRASDGKKKQSRARHKSQGRDPKKQMITYAGRDEWGEQQGSRLQGGGTELIAGKTRNKMMGLVSRTPKTARAYKGVNVFIISSAGGELLWEKKKEDEALPSPRNSPTRLGEIL